MPGKLINGRVEDQELGPISKASFILIFRNIPLIVLWLFHDLLTTSPSNQNNVLANLKIRWWLNPWAFIDDTVFYLVPRVGEFKWSSSRHRLILSFIAISQI